MTRKILFRGFHKDENVTETIYLNGEEIKGKWVYGNYIVDKWYEKPKSGIVPQRNNPYNLEIIEVIPETVSQYTGLDDKNGKKIFENDILLRTLYDEEKEYLKAEYKVIFDTKQPRFIINGISEELLYMNWKRNHKEYNQQLGSFGVEMSECEVIGTIFDEKEVK